MATTFGKQDRVVARPHVVRRQEDLAGRSGTVTDVSTGVAERINLYPITVKWDGIDELRNHAPTNLRLDRPERGNDTPAPAAGVVAEPGSGRAIREAEDRAEVAVRNEVTAGALVDRWRDAGATLKDMQAALGWGSDRLTRVRRGDIRDGELEQLQQAVTDALAS